MKAAFVLLALIGSVCALQYPVEYHYRYEGRLAKGIPAIRSQVAALGIKAKLILQMKDKSQGLAKLTDVQVGQYNDDLQCVQLRQPVPFSYSPMPVYKSQIEEPFAVYFKEEMDNVMKVPASDVEFITNIRKSIVEMLRVEPVVANLGGIKGDRFSKLVSEEHLPEAFFMEEETIFGRCESQYTLTKLPSYLAAEEMKALEKYQKEDAQSESSPRSSGASIPKISNEYYRLMRAINFDKCNDRVILQHAGSANMSHLGYGQFRSVQARSSVGTYLLKGKPGSFRVERAVVEDDVIMNPFGFKTHRLQTITNRTLVLESTQSIQTPLRLPSPLRTVKTWRQEVASPFSAPEGHPKPWVNYHNKNDKYFPVSGHYTTLGIFPKPNVVEEYKRNFMQMLEHTITEMYSYPSVPSRENPSVHSTKGSIVTTQLHFMSKMMRVLPRQAINEIFSHVFSERSLNGQRKQMMLVDIAAASGESAPIKALLEKMKSGHISHQRIASIFMTLPNNLLAPSIIPEILEYVKSLDMEREPLLTSSALVNAASLVERICMDPKKWNYTVPNELFGREVCKPSEILSNFLPFLKQKAQSASKSWERAVYLQAIANIGSTHIIPVLKPFIFGRIDSNPRVRSVAIYGLARKRLPDHAREMALDTLMSVFENLEEHPEMRQAAFIAIITWKPDSASWQTMARMTWKEPSQRVAALITFTIESLAESQELHLSEQASIAAFVLPLMKPFSPSMRYSFNYIFSRYSQWSKVGMNAEFAFFQSLRDVVPSEIYAAINPNAGGLNFNLFEVAMASEKLGKVFFGILNSLPSYRPEEGSYMPTHARDSSSRYTEEIMRKMDKYIETERSGESQTEANIYARAFDNMYQYIPINSEVISKIAGEGGSTFLRELIRGYKVNMTKFATPFSLEYMLPTGLGLPQFGSVEMPTVNLGDMEVKLVVPGQSEPNLRTLMEAREVIVLLKCNYKYMSKLIVKTQVPAPWNQKVIEAGIDNVHEINLPAYMNLTWTHTPEVKNLTFNMAPHTQRKFPLVYAHNVPFTQIRDMIPSTQPNSNFKVIAVQKSRTPVVQVRSTPERKYTGFNLNMMYEGDAQYPFTSANMFDYVRNPALWFKLMTSPTSKQWQYFMTVDPDTLAKNVSIALAYLTPQGSGGSQRIPDFSPNDSQSQRINKLKNFAEGSRVHAINAQLFFNGTEFRKYELLMALTRKSQSQEKKEYKTMLAFLASRIPGYTEESHALCSQAEVTTPAIHDYSSLKQAIQSQLEETIRGQIYYGKSCAASSVSSYEGRMKVSSKRQSQLREEVSKICNFDPMNPVVELQTAAVYDEGHLDIQFSKEQLPRSLVNLTYNAQELIEGYLYPQAYFNNMFHGSQNKITVQAQRPLSTKGYTFWVELPEKKVIYADIQVPYAFTRIVPWTGLKTSFTQSSNLIVATKMADRCEIKSDSVTTFDGVTYPFSPLHCYTTTAMDRKNREELLVYTYKNAQSQPEAAVIIGNDNANIKVSAHEVHINGQKLSPSKTSYVIKNKSGKPAIEIKKENGAYEVDVFGKLKVFVRNTIVLTPSSSMKGQLRGLCGDFDGETTYDKTGPKNCIYSDAKLFKYAWTIDEGEKCNHNELQAMQKEVRKFAQTCPKRPGTASNAFNLRADYKERAMCYQQVYPVKQMSNMLCQSEETVQICTEQCHSKQRQDKRVTAKCWTSQSAPAEIRNAVSVGYLKHLVNQPAQRRERMEVFADRKCA